MYLLITRHAETVEGIHRVSIGHTPGELSPRGWRQAQLLANFLAEYHLDAIVSSDLRRAHDTAAEVHRLHPWLPFYIVPELREADLGSDEGMRASGKYLTDPAPDAESHEALHGRAERVADQLWDRYQGKRVLSIGHKYINMAIVNVLHGGTPETFRTVRPQLNAEISEYELTARRTCIDHTLNYTNHLGDSTPIEL